MPKFINYQTIPAIPEEDYNQDLSTWRNGKYVALDLGKSLQVWIDHSSEVIVDDMTQEEKTIMRAFPIVCDKPITRGKLIDAAEREAYGLITDGDVASFNASLSRKFRTGKDLEEVREHDEFIDWVKDKLTEIGYE